MQEPYIPIGPVDKAGFSFVPHLREDMKPILAAQGCLFIQGEKDWNRHVIAIVYPPGSTRQEVNGSRDLIKFPNGFELLELKDSKRQCSGIYFDNRQRSANGNTQETLDTHKTRGTGSQAKLDRE